MDCSTPCFPVHHSLLALSQIHVYRISDAIQPSHPLLSPSLPAFNLSQYQGLFKVLAFLISGQSIVVSTFSISLSSEYSGLTSFRIDWFDLVAAQGTLKCLLQQNSSRTSILQSLAFLMVQLSHPYMTTGKIIALARRTFVGKVMSLLFNMLGLGWSQLFFQGASVF